MTYLRFIKSRLFRQAWVLLVCCLLSACDNPSAVVAQTPAEVSLHREAEMLLRTAYESLSQGAYDATFESSKKVASLLPKDARVQQRAAELMYLSGHVKESVPLFDLANELAPNRAAENWQRGIALATAGEFRRGAEQFKLHREVNPNDVENSAWYFLCIAKSAGLAAAKKSVIPSNGDARQPMMTILKMLNDEATPDEVLAVAEKVGPAIESKKSAQFYGDLYVGLYYDSTGRSEDAIKYLRRSLKYGISGYMADTSRVYLESRFEKSENADRNSQPK